MFKYGYKLIMSSLLIRLIFKQINQLRRQEPNIANRISQALRIHVEHYHRTRQFMLRKLKKQEDHELATAFLRFLEWANSANTFNAHRVKLRLVEVYTGINQFTDEYGVIKRDKLPLQMKVLLGSDHYKQLKTERERQFVRTVIRNLYKGEERYEYANLTEFFRDIKCNTTVVAGKEALELLSPDVREYVERVLEGKVEGVNRSFITIYRQMFVTEQKSNLEKVLDSYLKSRYILLDFSDISLRQ